MRPPAAEAPCWHTARCYFLESRLQCIQRFRRIKNVPLLYGGLMPTIIVENTACHYRTSMRAPEDALVVLCVHGSGATSIVWSYQISRLGKQFRIIAPDLPGHGESEGSVLASAAEYAQWLHRFIASLTAAPCYLCGHSFGGAVVQEYARLFPDAVRGLILIGTGTRFALSQAYRELLTRGIDMTDDTVLSSLPEPLRQGYAFLKRVGSNALHADLMAAGAFDSSAWISAVRKPTLIIRGSDDAITPGDPPRELAACIPGAVFEEIPGAGHVVMIDAPEAFNKNLKTFIETCEACQTPAAAVTPPCCNSAV